MQVEVIRWDERAAPDPRVLRRRLEAEGFDVLSWNDAPGTTYEPHTHEHDESLWICSGAMTFGIAGREHHLRAGDRLILPRGTVHTAVAGEQGTAYLVGQRR